MTTAKTQLDKFKATARELECDVSEKRFDTALKKIAKQKPKQPTPKTRAAKSQSR
jgi:hypothetical protein